MKLPILLLLSLSTLLPHPSTASPSPVRDTSGRILRPNRHYYILPVARGFGGGLSLASRNNLCPLYVAQENHEIDNGTPVSFTPVNTSDKVVRLSTDLNIQFSAITICIQSLVWRLTGDEGDTGRLYVATDGVKGNPGKETLSNWFKIKEHEDYYKIVFCPAVCDTCRPVCGDLGVFNEDGTRWLGLSEVPFRVMFKYTNSILG